MTGGQFVGSAVGGIVAGAIGAYVAEASGSHPILKGALAVGAINVLLAATLISGIEAGQQQKQIGTSGLGAHPMFP